MAEDRPNRISPKLSRRNILKSTGIAASAIIAPTTVGSTQTQPTIKREINELTGSARHKYINKAISDPEVENIIKEFKQDGWQPDESGATVYRVDKADEDSDLDFSRYHLASIPFQKPSKSQSESVQIFWSDKSLETVGFTLPIGFKLDRGSGDGASIATRDTKSSPVLTEYISKNGKIITDESVVEWDLGSSGKKEITTQSCYCETKVLECEDLSIWCYISLAVSYAGTYWSCAACGVGAWVACAKCAATVIGSGAGTIGCIENHECWEETLCRSYDEVERKPCRVCNNIHHPTC